MTDRKLFQNCFVFRIDILNRHLLSLDISLQRFMLDFARFIDDKKRERQERLRNQGSYADFSER
jgi:hypothetical protein